MAHPGGGGWGLEVVRGREVGRVYALRDGPNTLGNALDGAPGVDLGVEEGTSPRRMAPRQARVECSAGALALRDLDSPGGTFVNRQRVLPGQARRLDAGDVIQLGAVQLRVVAVRPADPPPVAKPVKASGMTGPFTLATGAVCRTWDDFLTASSQNWSALAAELTSGRLAAHLRAAGRDDLLPAAASSDPDERLDEWLARLPTTRPARPDLDVHPAVVRVRALPGGGVTRARVVVTNTGYRLLRSSVRVEPPAGAWVRLPPAFDRPFTTAETSEVPFDVEIPEGLAAVKTGALVVEGNGGVRRVEIRVEPAAAPEHPPDAAGPVGATAGEVLAKAPPAARFVGFALVFVVVGLLVFVGDRVAAALGVESGARPGLAGPAVALAAVGGGLAAWLARRRGEANDVPPAAFAGSFAGLLVAAVAVALSRLIEPSPPSSLSPALPMWGGLGALVAWASLYLVPHRPPEGKGP